eukprot:TRINITY_DN10103_c0_g1_i1.p1 TRINITY_DN10103_c0_g1~~TRINITY_DN10103_c0_g1_i1.p1  ORF type:complete len:978 (-),score=83.36 TRINITY_DN10103_c0_g1_i1:36-2948(-)
MPLSVHLSPGLGQPGHRRSVRVDSFDDLVKKARQVLDCPQDSPIFMKQGSTVVSSLAEIKQGITLYLYQTFPPLILPVFRQQRNLEVLIQDILRERVFGEKDLFDVSHYFAKKPLKVITILKSREFSLPEIEQVIDYLTNWGREERTVELGGSTSTTLSNNELRISPALTEITFQPHISYQTETVKETLDTIAEEIINMNELFDYSNEVAAQISSIHITCQNFNSFALVQLLPQLVELNLSNCQLKDVTFKPLTNLTKLVLDHNQLFTISSSMFEGLNKLKTLSASYNNIRNLEKNAFDLMRLESLSLIHNELQLLSSSVFGSKLVKLTSLDVSCNHLTNVESLTLGFLEELDLHQNFIEYLNEDSFIHMRYLRRIDLSYNALKALPPSTFSKCSQLRILDLHSNLLQQFDCYCLLPLPRLEFLDLSWNLLEGFVGSIAYKMNTTILLCYNRMRIPSTHSNKLSYVPQFSKSVLSQPHKENIYCPVIKSAESGNILAQYLRGNYSPPTNISLLSRFELMKACRYLSLPHEPLGLFWTFSKWEQIDVSIAESRKSEQNELIKFFETTRASYLISKEKKDLNVGSKTSCGHILFVGGPGTGKTTAARDFAQILFSLGVIPSVKFTEISRAELVAGVMGQTSAKTKKAIQSALGGVLLIDEAYSIVKDSRDTFGQEAVDTMIQEIENNRDQLVVILAGYPEEMNEFLNVNAGLRSRIEKKIHFYDYTADQMLRLAKTMLAVRSNANESDLIFVTNTQDKLLEIFKMNEGKHSFGNGRGVRNIVNIAIENQNLRLTKIVKESLRLPLKKELQTIIAEDITYSSPSELINFKEVQDFLTRLDLGYLSRRFEEHQISGPMLPHLTENDLIAAGISLVGTRRKILTGIKGLVSCIRVKFNPSFPNKNGVEKIKTLKVNNHQVLFNINALIEKVKVDLNLTQQIHCFVHVDSGSWLETDGDLLIQPLTNNCCLTVQFR